MNESTIDILGSIISVIILIFSGVVAGWVWGYGAGYRKAFRKSQQFLWHLNASSLLPANTQCTQCEGTMFDHFHGCTIAAEFKLVTIAKPGG